MKDEDYELLKSLEPFDNAAIIETLWDFNYGNIYETYIDDEKLIVLHTGGWSENEEIVAALQQSPWWKCNWYQSRTGGHYWLRTKN